MVILSLLFRQLFQPLLPSVGQEQQQSKDTTKHQDGYTKGHKSAGCFCIRLPMNSHGPRRGTTQAFTACRTAEYQLDIGCVMKIIISNARDSEIGGKCVVARIRAFIFLVVVRGCNGQVLTYTRCEQNSFKLIVETGLNLQGNCSSVPTRRYCNLNQSTRTNEVFRHR